MQGGISIMQNLGGKLYVNKISKRRGNNVSLINFSRKISNHSHSHFYYRQHHVYACKNKIIVQGNFIIRNSLTSREDKGKRYFHFSKQSNNNYNSWAMEKIILPLSSKNLKYFHNSNGSSTTASTVSTATSSGDLDDRNLYLDNYENILEHVNNVDEKESPVVNKLKEKTHDCIRKTKEQITNIVQTYPDTPLSICTPHNVLGGLRNTITLLTDTSILESKKGILFRGKTVEKTLKDLPKWNDECEYPTIEAMLWFLLTNEIPENADLKLLSKELCYRAQKIPSFVFDYIDNIPSYVHPMSQLISTVSFLESFSLFKLKYSKGILKQDYWKYVLEDALSLIAQVQLIGAYIFKKTFINNNIKKGEGMELNIDYDWSANFAKLIGYEAPEIQDMFRLYFVLHCDHEGGNASAHAAHLIGSTLGNPYLSFIGCVTALAGPLHGLANQECLNFILGMKNKLGKQKITDTFVEKYAKDILKSGKVIPGYGHAVLRVPDPRFLAFRDFALKHFPEDPIVQILEMCYKIIPNILIATGKVKNPYPNVDFYSGSLLYHYGIKYPQYYTVLFALSRAIGVMSQLVISRGLLFPLERPKSVDIYNLKKLCKKSNTKIEHQ